MQSVRKKFGLQTADVGGDGNRLQKVKKWGFMLPPDCYCPVTQLKTPSTTHRAPEDVSVYRQILIDMCLNKV